MASPESKVGENALPRMVVVVVVGVLQGHVDTGGVKNWGHYCSQSNTLTSIIFSELLNMSLLGYAFI